MMIVMMMMMMMMMTNMTVVTARCVMSSKFFLQITIQLLDYEISEKKSARVLHCNTALRNSAIRPM
jgi:hypothetical protein